MARIAERMQSIKPSPTLAVSQKAAALKAQGVDIISLGAGEPDFDTHQFIKDAACEAIQEGHTKYTNVSGTAELKNAIIEKLKRDNNLEYKPEEIIVGTGGKQVIYNLFMASINPGDEVLIPAPYWVSYPDIVSLSEGVPKIIACSHEENFKLSAEKLQQNITDKTKWLILNSPSNPTGSTYNAQELREIADILAKHPDIYVMCDDIYENIVFDDFKFHTLAEIAPELKDRIMVVNGVSKSYAMTGWRIGYGAGPAELIKAMSTLQSQSTSSPCSISQKAAVAALNGPQDYLKDNKQLFEKRRDKALEILNDNCGLECNIPEGAFYIFPSCAKLIGGVTPQGTKLETGNDVAAYLLESAKVAVVPGIAFGSDRYFRISYATSMEVLTEACTRIRDACRAIK